MRDTLKKLGEFSSAAPWSGMWTWLRLLINRVQTGAAWRIIWRLGAVPSTQSPPGCPFSGSVPDQRVNAVNPPPPTKWHHRILSPLNLHCWRSLMMGSAKHSGANCFSASSLERRETGGGGGGGSWWWRRPWVSMMKKETLTRCLMVPLSCTASAGFMKMLKSIKRLRCLTPVEKKKDLAAGTLEA